ncbi:MAG: diguanylate cyclase [Microvirga sp.]|nr:diguanylate cyclase [Microvirga sp.]
MTSFGTIAETALLALVEATGDAILVTSSSDLNQPGPSIIYVNPAFCRISGYSKEEVLGKSPRILQGPGTCRSALARIGKALRAGLECREELLNYSKNGTPYWLDIHIVPLRDETGAIQYFGAIERDVTQKRSVVERLERLALEDLLTGIGNRAALQDHMEELAQSSTAGGAETPCMLLFDLDGFKEINDTLGHIAGDEILRRFAGYVASTLRRDDFMARLGGDEFVAILKGYTPDAALSFAEQVVANLAEMEVSGASRIGVSVGMTCFQPGDEMVAVIARADTALYRAKDAGRGVVRVYSRSQVA